jgi:large conductance mechanosensitive channel
VKAVLADFKKFILRGNVIDLAVAVVIGIAFKAVVDSFVNDIFNGLIGAIGGQPNFNDLVINVGDGKIRYGAFLTSILSFLIVAAALFIIIKAFETLQNLRGTAVEQAEPLTLSEELLTEIRDALVQPRS